MHQPHSFGLLSVQQVDDAWPRIQCLLAMAEAFSPDGTTAETIRAWVHEDRAHIFALITPHGMEAAMAMTFNTWAFGKMAGKTMTISLFGGKHTRLIFEQYGDRVQQFARDNGANRIAAWCRPSAARLFNSITGTKTTHYLISKDLT